MPKPMKFRKRPVVIEAMQYTIENCRALHDWMGYEHDDDSESCRAGIYIETLEGKVMASLYDWIIKGVEGEFYPCKPTIFESTYELVSHGLGPALDAVRCQEFQVELEDEDV